MQNQQAAQESLLTIAQISLLDGSLIVIILILLVAFLYLVGHLTQTSPFAENEFRRPMGTRVQATNPLNGHPQDN